jgi:hypothetical protein
MVSDGGGSKQHASDQAEPVGLVDRLAVPDGGRG